MVVRQQTVAIARRLRGREARVRDVAVLRLLVGAGAVAGVLAAGDFTLEEAQTALGAISLLPGRLRPAALELLEAVCREHGTRLDVIS